MQEIPLQENGEQLKKDVVITIRGLQRYEDDKDIVELVTTGRFYRKQDTYYLAYEETEATGFEGCRTTLKVGPNRKVTMTRFGTTRTQLVVEDGIRHQCQYDTGQGQLTIGVMGNHFASDLTDNGGELEFGYSLDIEASVASENFVAITVREA